ncbi:MAG TPA: hypothetical protein VLG11_00160 [Candidatus Saccharimonadales bacterium]|nr:hypothetical protein [Candidatus Saccharimonadales bacterium]
MKTLGEATTQRQTALNGIQKTVLFLLCAFDAWAILENDQITNALAGLFFGGQVPGTKIVLSPDTMIDGALGLSLLGVVTLVWLGVRRWLHTRAALHDVLHTRPRIVASVLLQQLTEAEPLTDAPKPSPKQHIVLPKLRTSRLHGPRLIHGLLFMAYVIFWALSVAVMALALGMQRAIEWTMQRSAAAWRWMSPHLWAFDGWLERRTHQTLAHTKKKLRQNEAAAVLLDYFAR